jgi:hypothetical protein
MDTTQTKTEQIAHSPFDDDDHAAGFCLRDPSDPPVDYQPESGQPGPRQPTDVEDRDEDDDL